MSIFNSVVTLHITPAFFRAEEFLGLVDIRKKMIKNPSERMKDN